jgi:Mn2+/Fe2+ NRAMP family transporter
MNTQIASKIVTLTAALVMNGLILVGVALLFDGQSHQQFGSIASAQATAQSTRQAT